MGWKDFVHGYLLLALLLLLLLEDPVRDQCDHQKTVLDLPLKCLNLALS